MSRPDLLRMDYINSLPQPFIATLIGSGDRWPVYDFDVGTGCMRIDVVGLLEIKHIVDARSICDANGVEHDPDTFFTDHETDAEDSSRGAQQ